MYSVFTNPAKGEVDDSMCSIMTVEDCEIPEETDESIDLKHVYAYNGYYGRSKDKREMLEKNVFYENFVDVVDE